MDNLVEHLINAGLLQFGYFEDSSGEGKPIQLRLDLLPAYPEILGDIGEQVTQLLNGHKIERIICDSESIAIGIATSLAANIPLVYARGKGEAALYDLVGAYDVGHPAALVLSVYKSPQKIARLIDNARRVGLNIELVITVVAISKMEHKGVSLLDLQEIVDYLTEQGQVPKTQQAAVSKWIRQQQTTTPHLD